MAWDTKVEWCHATFNPWRGCTKVSEGCRACYAETLSHRNPLTLGVWGPKGTRVVAAEAAWREPLKWDKAAAKAGERHRVFCASLADVFEDWTGDMRNAAGHKLWKVPGGNWIASSPVGFGGTPQPPDKQPNPDVRPLTMGDVRARLFDLIYKTPNLDWLLLTKRPENAARMMGPDGVGLYAHADGPVPRPQSNLWIGTSCENQAAADERIPLLLKTPARVRFLSCEPLLGPVDLSRFHIGWSRCPKCDRAADPDEEDPLGSEIYCRGCENDKPLPVDGHHLHWVIVGGESGPGARPCNVEWIRGIVRQCEAAGVPAFVKQLGGNAHRQSVYSGNPVEPLFPLTLRDRKGGDIEEFPADLRVRQFPEATCG